MKRLSVLLIGLALSLSACADTSTIGTSGSGAAGPIKADISVTASDGKTVATGHSDEDGTYRIALPPGSYTVTANHPGGAIGSGKPIMVEVPAGTYVHLNLLVDSGIR